MIPKRKPPVRLLIAIGLIAGIAGILCGYLSTLPMDRIHSTYRPGDCVGSPVVQHERWETPRHSKIFMIAEVGDHKYNLRGWGGGGGGSFLLSKPHWYSPEETSYQAVSFREIDDTRTFEPIPCPEEGPDLDGDNVLSFNSTTGSFVTVEPGDTITVNSGTVFSNTVSGR